MESDRTSPSETKRGGYQGSSDPGEPTQLMQPQTQMHKRGGGTRLMERDRITTEQNINALRSAARTVLDSRRPWLRGCVVVTEASLVQLETALSAPPYNEPDAR